MEEKVAVFNSISANLSNDYSEVAPGKMMSAEGIKYKTKVFAFYYEGQMVFRMGKQFEPESQGITQYSHLSPFKNKPPMRGWLEVPAIYHQKWAGLAQQALEKIKSEIG